MAYQIRETAESALAMGEKALLTVGAEPDVASAIMEQVRDRDAERLSLEVVDASTWSRPAARQHERFGA